MSWTKTRSQIATTKRLNPDADLEPLRQQLRAERLEEYVAKVVADAPPFTAAQREAILAAFAGLKVRDAA